jgi:hypothetical protein
MTKGRTALPLRAVAEQKPFSAAWVGEGDEKRLLFPSSATALNGSATLPFVIPTEA